MSRKRKSSGWSFSSEREFGDGYIHYRPDIELFGEFHEGIGHLISNILDDRLHDVLNEVSKYLRDPKSVDPDEEAAE